MDNQFDIIEYLSGLTTYVFDKALLKRVAYEVGIEDVTRYACLSQEEIDLCRIKLLEAAYFSPNSIAGSTQTHGAFTLTIGQQQITASEREAIAAELKRLYKKYNMDDKLEELDDTGSVNQWVNEYD